MYLPLSSNVMFVFTSPCTFFPLLFLLLVDLFSRPSNHTFPCYSILLKCQFLQKKSEVSISKMMVKSPTKSNEDGCNDYEGDDGSKDNNECNGKEP